MTRWLLIHNFYFWCKINKFISFFSKKQWKSCEKLQNKQVDILHACLHDGISTLFSLLFPQSYPQYFRGFPPSLRRGACSRDISWFLWLQRH